jgi:hypothetical protein
VPICACLCPSVADGSPSALAAAAQGNTPPRLPGAIISASAAAGKAARSCDTPVDQPARRASRKDARNLLTDAASGTIASFMVGADEMAPVPLSFEDGIQLTKGNALGLKVNAGAGTVVA